MSVSHLGLRLLSLVLLGPLAGQAYATQASLPKPGDLDLIRDRQERLLEEQRRRLEELQELPGKQISPGVPVQAADSRCFPIQEIQLKGADSLSANERDTMFQPYIGQCLGVSQLNELLKVITNHYIDRGLVTTRAYLPQQDLSQRCGQHPRHEPERFQRHHRGGYRNCASDHQRQLQELGRWPGSGWHGGRYGQQYS